MPATVTLSLEEFDGYRRSIEDLNQEVASLKQKIIDTKMAAAGGEVAKLTELSRASMHVAGFAMANLSPEVVKGWPFVELARVGALVEAMPDCNPFDQEIGAEMVKFAREAEVWENRRKQATERYVPPPPPRAVANAAKLAEEASQAVIDASQETLAKGANDVG